VIHYHGTPITPRPELENMAGRHFCVSYASPQDLKTCLRIGASVMLDNGAFSAFTRGLELNEAGFYSWLEPILGHPHWAVVPDVIDGTVEQQRERADRWPFSREFGAPVWHLGLPVDYLLELVDNWPRVCFGSSGQFWQVGSIGWNSQMTMAFNELVKRRTRLPWIHGLRMLGVVQDWPLASADSTNVAQNYKRRPGCAECMAAQLDAINSPIRWDEKEFQGELTL
jgi:hypothetical protein